MGSIQVLSFEVANLIAAGEVVDRPASAVKEMMENAIDAGASHITVEIQNGGVSFMRVTDDGCGMSEEDLPMAIRRHATSKIRDASDLDGILTLGFRGEALAAISSVSDMRIMSKRADDPIGHMLEVRGGAIIGVSEYGCRTGTTIIVEHLFANVPARRKFLKRDVTEAMAVSANVERVALSHPEIAVRFISDGTPRLDTVGDGKLLSAVHAVFGRDFAARLLTVSSAFDGIRVEGFIGRSDNVKANRNGQSFFINHRYIKSRTAQAALEEAYVSYLPPEKYPVCVLNIDLNPARVDVNVHPAKLEVKFSNEKPVFEAVYYAVRQTLEQNTTRPELSGGAFRPSGAGAAQGQPSGGSLTGRGSVRVSDMTTPIDNVRPESLGKRQLSMTDAGETLPTASASGPKPPQEHMTAGEFRALAGAGNDRAAASRTTSGERAGQVQPKPSPSAQGAPVREAPPAAEPPRGTPAKPAPGDPGWFPTTAEEYAALLAGTQTIPPEPDGTEPPPEEIPPEVPEAEARELFGAPQAPAEAPQPDTPPEPPVPDHPPVSDHPPVPVKPPVPEVPSAPAMPPEPEGSPVPDEPSVPEAPILTAPAGAMPKSYRIIGEAFRSYVLVERGEKLLLIDKHAAHERIIFEQLKARLREKSVDQQLLMIPIDVMLMSDEVGLIDAYRAELEAVGFSFSCLRNTVRVDAIPSGIQPGAVPDMFGTFAAQFRTGAGSARLTRDILFEKALFQASCKAAIKAGRDYPPEQVAWVVDQLMQIPDITFCPHGRPVAMEITKHSLDHQFERC